MEHGPRDERRLVRDPEVLDRVVGVDKDDPFVSQPRLKDRAVLLGPFLGNSGMVVAKLKEIAKERNARNLREVFDSWNIGGVEVSSEEQQHSCPDGDIDLGRQHGGTMRGTA